ncbi:hypothetical protein Tco_1085318 [Tanacetum coccineum]
MFQDFRNSDIVRPSRSDEVLKLKNFEKDASLQLSSYQIKKGMSMSVPKSQGSQDGKDYKMAKRDYAWLMISKCSRSHTHIQVKVKGMCSSLKVKITTTYSQDDEIKEIHVCEHKNEDSAYGGDLILYQAYGNLYAMTGRKLHLLEDKQILSVGVFDEVSFYTLFRALGWLLKEIHVTWAHLEKKQTRLRLYTKSLKKLCIQSVETALRVSSDGVRTFEVTASTRG